MQIFHLSNNIIIERINYDNISLLKLYISYYKYISLLIIYNLNRVLLFKKDNYFELFFNLYYKMFYIANR